MIVQFCWYNFGKCDYEGVLTYKRKENGETCICITGNAFSGLNVE